MAREIFQQIGYWLGVGIAALVTLFDFELVVIGGGVAAAGDLILVPARASFEQFVFARAHRKPPIIVPATLGAEAGWIGAALLALSQHVATARQSDAPPEGLVAV
jgi:glucokinase